MADKPDAKGSIDSYLAGVSDAKADNPGASSPVDKVAYDRGVNAYYDNEFDKVSGSSRK